MTQPGLRRFTMAEARQIRAAARRGVPRTELAALYDCDRETISRIVRGTTYRMPYRSEPRGKAAPDCPCPSCVRQFQPPPSEDVDAPASVSLSWQLIRQLRLLAKEFDSQSIRCPWHKAILLVGQRCPSCEYVRLPATAEDYIDYIEVDSNSAVRGAA